MSARITDSVSQVVTLNLSAAPMLAMGMTYAAMANSIGNLMGNAVTAEQFSQIIQNTSTTQCCALIVSVGAAGAAKAAG